MTPQKYIASRLFLAFWLLYSTTTYALISGSDITISVYNGDDTPTISQLIDSEAFVSLNTNNTVQTLNPWLKIEWDKSQITNERFLLNNDFNVNLSYTYLVINDKQIIAEYSSNKNFSYTNNDAVEHFKNLISIEDADYVLAKICCNPRPSRYFSLLSVTEAIKNYHRQTIFYAMAYAIIALMILYNFVIWLYLQESRYFWYCCYLSSGLWGLFSLSGIGNYWIWTDFHHSYLLYYNQSALFSISSMLFVLSFLDNRHISKTTFKLTYAAIAICVSLMVLSLLCYLLDIDRLTQLINAHITIVQTTAWVGFLMNNYIIIRSLIAGDAKAKIILFSYAIIDTGMLIITLRTSYKVPDTFWTQYAMEIAFILEAVILSLFLARDLQQLRNEKLLAEAKQRKLEQQFSWQLIEVQEEEKRQIGSALHDNFTQKMLVLKNSLLQKIGNGIEIDYVNQVMNEMRDLSHIVHPYLLEQLGLYDALRNMFEQVEDSQNLEINFAYTACVLSAKQNLVVFRIVQEALNNIIKHANASECLVVLGCQQGQVNLLIRDDGDGFDTHNKHGFGITMMKTRCKSIRASFDISSDANGSDIKVSFALHPSVCEQQSQPL